MGSINQVTLVGRLGQDAEIKSVNGTPLAKFSIATSERYKDKSGEYQEKTEWHRCNMWGTVVDAIGKYLLKGTQVGIQGSLSTRAYDKDGQTHKVTEIRVREYGGLALLGDKPKSRTASRTPASASASVMEFPGVDDDDVPF
jgi:single-strand DNA-binding protein